MNTLMSGTANMFSVLDNSHDKVPGPFTKNTEGLYPVLLSPSHWLRSRPLVVETIEIYSNDILNW